MEVLQTSPLGLLGTAPQRQVSIAKIIEILSGDSRQREDVAATQTIAGELS